MFVLGLTGGIATGKSNVTDFLREQGVPVVDADALARRVVDKGEAGYDAILAHFGPSFFDGEGNLDRRKLGEYIFAHPQEREALDAMIHPAVDVLARRELAALAAQGEKIAVLAVPLLFEAGMQPLADEVWLMDISDEEQLRRLMQRDGLTQEKALRRIRAQMSQAKKRQLADRCIDSSGTIEDTRALVEGLWKELLSRVGT